MTSFIENPTFRWLIGKSRFSNARLECLAQYCLQVAMLKEGAFISSDGHGIVLLYDNRKRVALLTILKLHFKLIHHCVGWHRLHRVLLRELQFSCMRRREHCLYVLALAIEESGRGSGTAIELKNAIFEMSRSRNLPLQSETTLIRNRRIYERFGFKTYATCVPPCADFTVWFMMKEITP